MALQVSASGLERAEVCPPSHALPIVRTAPGVAAERGTAIHTFLETYWLRGQTAAHAFAETLDPAWAATCYALDVPSMLPLGSVKETLVEATYVYDWFNDSARLAGTCLNRNYSVTDQEIPGTADLVCLMNDGSVYVADYKTGRKPVEASSLQLQFLAMAAARHHGASRAHVRVIQFDEDGVIDNSEAKFVTLETWDLGSVRARLRRIGKGILEARTALALGQRLDVRVGDHCKWCPALPHCPGHNGLIAHLLALANPDGLSDEEVGAAWLRLVTAKSLLEQIEASLKLRISSRENGVPTPLGQTVREVRQTREYVDGKRALTLLRSEFGDDVTRRFEPKITKGMLYQLFKDKGYAKADIDQAFYDLRQKGAFFPKEFINYELKEAT